jgi:hypothetical protein
MASDDRDVSGMLVKHGHITGLDDIKYERTLEVILVSQSVKPVNVFPLTRFTAVS